MPLELTWLRLFNDGGRRTAVTAGVTVSAGSPGSVDGVAE